MEISATAVKELREKTGAGVMDCKRALQETNGDFDKATEILRRKGEATAEKKAGRVANQGLIETYIHTGNRLGAMIEISCETDFVARTDAFEALAHDIAMQVAATNPTYVSEADIPADMVDREKAILREEAAGKPPAVMEKIVDGKWQKFLAEHCLVNQPFIRDPNMTVADLIKDNIRTMGENIIVRRFVRYELGKFNGEGEPEA